VGSTNLDFRSFRLNAECNWVVIDNAVAATAARQSQDDLGRSREMTAQRWPRRFAMHRLGDALAWRLGPLL
jgi:cardiolipin synthase